MFTEPMIWDGGKIDLLCSLGPSSPGLRARVQRAIWAWPGLVGPYAHRDVEPEHQAVGEPDDDGFIYGVASLPGGIGQVAFSVFIVEDDEALWLYAGTPLGSLGQLLPVGGFPFGEAANAVAPWERTVHDWLRGLAEHLHAREPIVRATIGWVTYAEVIELSAGLLPEVRYHGYLVPEGPVLQYYPPNRSEPLFTFHAAGDEPLPRESTARPSGILTSLRSWLQGACG